MKTTVHLPILSIIFSLLFISCVSGKKIIDSETKIDMFEKGELIKHNKLQECDLQIKYIFDKSTFLQKTIV
jgi:hypothetical protein